MSGAGHNNPPSPIEETEVAQKELVKAFFAEDQGLVDAMEEAANWLDGEEVKTEAQLEAVDEILDTLKKGGTAIGKAKDKNCGVLHKMHRAATKVWGNAATRIDDRKKGLIKASEDFRIKLKEEADEKARELAIEARKKREEAAEAAKKADASNLEAVEEARRLKEEADKATEALRAAPAVKGVRKTWQMSVADFSALLNDINSKDRRALEAFAEDYARKQGRESGLAGINWKQVQGGF